MSAGSSADFYGSTESPGNSVSFTLGWFAPRYYPNEVEVTKARNLKKEQSMCEGEYVYDVGGKNRTINVRGYVLGDNLPAMNDILESGRPMELIAMNWSGEVLIEEGATVGPEMYDGGEDSWLYEYTLKAVSTARDEPGMTNYGIINGASQSRTGQEISGSSTAYPTQSTP